MLLLVVPLCGRDRPDVGASLKRASQLSLYSVSPMEIHVTDLHGNPTDEDRQKERFHGLEVYRKVIGADPETVEKIRRAVIRMIESVKPGPPLQCFDPHHAVCFQDGDGHFDLLLCVECQKAQVIFFNPDLGSHEDFYFGIGVDGFDDLDQLLASAPQK